MKNFPMKWLFARMARRGSGDFMGRFCWAFGIVALVIAACMSMARAETKNPCPLEYVDVEKQIVECSALVKAGDTEAKHKLTIAYIARGNKYMNLRKYDRAIIEYDKAVAVSPEYMWGLMSRGDAYITKGDYDRAIKDFDKVISLEKDDFDSEMLVHGAYEKRGVALLKMGKYARAIANFDKAIALEPLHNFPDWSETSKSRDLAIDKLRAIGKAKANQLKYEEQQLSTKDTKAVPSKPDSHPEHETAKPITTKPVRVIANTDVSGSLIAKQTKPDAKACAAQCSSDETCAAWTWNVWNAMCFTKSSADETLYEPSSVSGMAKGKSAPPKSNLPMTMVRYRGKGFDVSKAKATTEASFEDCETSCKASKNCAVFSWQREGENACYLIPRTTSAYETDPQFDSGAKRQVAN
jgi:tetratricopeptide (TPR) repeat protein